MQISFVIQKFLSIFNIFQPSVASGVITKKLRKSFKISGVDSANLLRFTEFIIYLHLSINF